MFKAELIGFLVTLRPRGLHGRSFRFVQEPELDRSEVCVDRHLPAERIDFPNDLALGLATNRGIAAHLGDRVDIPSQEQGGGTHSGGNHRGLDTCMTGAANDHVKR